MFLVEPSPRGFWALLVGPTIFGNYVLVSSTKKDKAKNFLLAEATTFLAEARTREVIEEIF